MLAVLPASAVASTATEIIVKRDPGLNAAERTDIRADAQVKLVETLPVPRTELVAARPGDVRDALRDLAADPDVVYAQLNHVRQAAADPALDVQWGIRNFAQLLDDDDPYSWGLFDADSDVPEAWAQVDLAGDAITGKGQTVAVVDSGIAGHPDLDPARVEALNFVTGETTPVDGDGHGTHVAGIIGATRGNAHGGVGVAPEADILSLRALGDDGRGTDEDIGDAFLHARDAGVKVVNASLSGDLPAPYLADTIRLSPDTLFIVAAGNDERDADATPSYPCDIDEPNVICVGASTHRDEVADFSNYGEESVDLFAPGDEIVSTYLNNGYVWNSGTSMAAPFVAGAAALALQADPTLTAENLKDVLFASVDKVDAFDDKSVTGGRLNAALAVAHALGDVGDMDGDQVLDAVDACITEVDPEPHQPEGCQVPDADSDEVADWYDNCDTTENPGQADVDRDGLGDACDGDIDGDTLVNASDNCPTVANAGQADSPDRDGLGDACDTDRDNDGVANGSDLCPTVVAPGTSNGCPAPPPPPPTKTPPPPSPPADTDRDGRPDGSDACPAEPALSADGCPLAQVASLSAKAKKRGAKRTATVRVRATRIATIRVIVERKKGRRWVRVARRTTAGTGTTLRVSRLKRGAHRVRVSISSSAGRGSSVTKRFRVR